MAGGASCAKSTVAGAGGGGDTHDVGGVEGITRAAIGKGCSRVAHAGVGGPCGEVCTGNGDHGVGVEAGGVVGGRGVRAGEGHVRGERRRSPSSPPSLSSSASHRLLAAFIVCLAGGGEGFGEEPGECSGRVGSCNECSGTVSLGW